MINFIANLYVNKKKYEILIFHIAHIPLNLFNILHKTMLVMLKNPEHDSSGFYMRP